MGKKTQRAWSPEARQRHLDGCRRYQEEYKKMDEQWKWAQNIRNNYPGGAERLDEILDLASELKRQGIDPVECLNFAILVKENKRNPLTEDQNLESHELLLQKVPAAKIYKQMFGEVAA